MPCTRTRRVHWRSSAGWPSATGCCGGEAMTASQATVLAFAVVTVGLVLLEGMARRSASWPNIGDVFTVLMRRPAGRVFVMLGWGGLGRPLFLPPTPRAPPPGG